MWLAIGTRQARSAFAAICQLSRVWSVGVFLTNPAYILAPVASSRHEQRLPRTSVYAGEKAHKRTLVPSMRVRSTLSTFSISTRDCKLGSLGPPSLKRQIENARHFRRERKSAAVHSRFEKDRCASPCVRAKCILRYATFCLSQATSKLAWVSKFLLCSGD